MILDTAQVKVMFIYILLVNIITAPKCGICFSKWWGISLVCYFSFFWLYLLILTLIHLHIRATKTNYNIALHGAAMQRIQESLFRYANGLTQGGRKMRGDHIISLYLVSAFIFGGGLSALCAIYIHLRPLFILMLSLYIAIFEGDLGLLSPHNWHWYRTYFNIDISTHHQDCVDVWENDEEVKMIE